MSIKQGVERNNLKRGIKKQNLDKGSCHNLYHAWHHQSKVNPL
jgi:hypothetical protein